VEVVVGCRETVVGWRHRASTSASAAPAAREGPSPSEAETGAWVAAVGRASKCSSRQAPSTCCIQLRSRWCLTQVGFYPPEPHQTFMSPGRLMTSQARICASRLTAQMTKHTRNQTMAMLPRNRILLRVCARDPLYASDNIRTAPRFPQLRFRRASAHPRGRGCPPRERAPSSGQTRRRFQLRLGEALIMDAQEGQGGVWRSAAALCAKTWRPPAQARPQSRCWSCRSNA